MAQLKAKGYADKYRHLGQPIHLGGRGIQPGDAQPDRICGRNRRRRWLKAHRSSAGRGSEHPPASGFGEYRIRLPGSSMEAEFTPCAPWHPVQSSAFMLGSHVAGSGQHQKRGGRHCSIGALPDRRYETGSTP